MIIEQWIIVDELGQDPVATLRGHAWAWVSRTSNRHELVMQTCAGQDRLEIPVAVVTALLDVANRRLKRPR